MTGLSRTHEQFLLIRKSIDDSEPYLNAKIVTAGEVIDYVNFTDIYSDFEDYEVYAIKDIGQVERLTYVGWQPGCLIELKDNNGNVVLSGYGDDH